MRADAQTDGRTDTMKLIVAFRNFDNAPKNMEKKYKLKLKYNYSIIKDFSSKTPPSTPHAGFIGTNTPHILFLEQ